MKTKTDDYLEEILERFEKLKFYSDAELKAVRYLLGNNRFEIIRDFIIREFREYAKNISEDK